MSIEEVLEITNWIENVDGDDVYVLGRDMKEGIENLRKKTILEKDNCMFSMLSKDLEFICSHVGFSIAFRPVGKNDNKQWIPCMLYKYEGEWRRVLFQYAHCLKCDWCGNIANPTDPDLYITMNNRFEILKKMNQLSFCQCPKCGGQLSSKAIWIEQVE